MYFIFVIVRYIVWVLFSSGSLHTGCALVTGVQTCALPICRAYATSETPEDTPPDLGEIESILGADSAITHVAAVHCETTSGILNPVGDIAALVAGKGRRFLLDAMSAFGALPFDVASVLCDAVAASSNKCLDRKSTRLNSSH